MLFTTPQFIFLFLPICLIFVGLAIRFTGMKGGFIALSLSSIVFYAQWHLPDVLVILSSIAVNFTVAYLLSSPKTKHRFPILFFGVAVNILALIYYKYTNFILTNFGYSAINIILPLGISFFTFQQIAFIVDIYRGDVGKIVFSNYAVTVLFFPHLIAGPLIHYKAIMDQFERNFSVKLTNIVYGFSIFTVGLAKKLAIADPIAIIINPIFQKSQVAPLEFFSAWAASLGYTAQLYFDFSGYSDMAIGIGLMFGIVLPMNFNSPYRSTSIIEFWRRWHITLSLFLRDYLYIPLGGNRVPQVRWYTNLLIVMAIGGFWHGAGWNFIIWGGLHGIYLVTNHIWRRNIPNKFRENYILHPIYWAITFFSVIFAWDFFRAPTIHSAINIIKYMFCIRNASLPGEIGLFTHIKNGHPFGILYTGTGITFPNLCSILVYLIFGYAIILMCPNSEKLTGVRSKIIGAAPPHTFGLRDVAQAMLVGALLWIAAFGVFGAAPSEFLYFQF